MYLKLLKINSKKFLSYHTSVANTYNNLALIYKDQGKFNKVEELYLKSLKIKIKKLRLNHTLFADNLDGSFRF